MERLSRGLALAGLAVLAVGCASTPYHAVSTRFRYRVPFRNGKYESVGKNAVQVTEVWGTRPRIEIGGDYLVVGRYTLATADSGTVFFYETADNWDNTGPVMDLQMAPVKRGTGTFTLLNSMPGPGRLHVCLDAPEGSKDLADLYIGNGKTSPPKTSVQ